MKLSGFKINRRALLNSQFTFLAAVMGLAVIFSPAGSPLTNVASAQDAVQDNAAANAENSQDAGEEDLVKATTLKLEAKELSDLDKVIDLCESAIKKGLGDDSKKSAEELLQGVLLDYAKRLASPIFDGERPDPRWQFMRQQALKKLDRLEELGNEWSETYILIAKLNGLPEGDRKKAQEAASKAVKFAGEDKHLLSEALYVRASLTEDEQARIADINQAVKIDPSNEQALRQRAAYYLAKGQQDKAIEDFEKLVEITGGEPLAYQQLIESMLIAGRVEDALSVSQEAIDKDPTQAGIYSLRGRIFLSQADDLQNDEENKDLSEEEKKEVDKEVKDLTDSALAELDKAVELAPQDILSLLLRAEVHLRNDALDKAKEDIEKLLVIRPGLSRAIFLRSIIAASESRFGDAAKDMELLVRSEPDNLQYRIQLGNMYSGDERPNKAIKIFKDILQQDNENRFALRGLADAQLSVGDHEKAKENYDRALEIEPKDDHVLNNLAWLLATSPEEKIRDGKRSIELGLKACELTDYKQAHILSTLAAGYAETGDFENARKWSEKAVELGKEDTIEDLKKELESYRQNKPWREKQEKKDKESGVGGGGDFEF